MLTLIAKRKIMYIPGIQQVVTFGEGGSKPTNNEAVKGTLPPLYIWS